MFQGWASALCCLMLLATTASAQNPPPPPSPQFSSILQAQQHRDAVIDAAKHSTTWIRHGCQSGSFTPLPVVKVWKRPEFDATNRPIAGLWGERVEASGCGITRLLNVATSVRSPGALVTGILAPGDTGADPTMQMDASRYAFTAAVSPGCQQAYLDDTHAVRKEKADDPRVNGPVSVEDWTVVACGRTVVVEVKFIPTANGTTVVAHAL